MKSGDLVKYRRYHKTLQGLTGLVIETRHPPHGDARARILWSAIRPDHVRWDWIEELRVINEGR